MGPSHFVDNNLSRFEGAPGAPLVAPPLLPRNGLIQPGGFLDLETLAVSLPHGDYPSTSEGSTLRPANPVVWQRVPLLDLSANEIAVVRECSTRLYAHALSLAGRITYESSRSLGDAPRYSVAFLHSDGRVSQETRNNPPLVPQNNCAEMAQIMNILCREALGEKIAPVDTIVLVGLPSIDGKRSFTVHPTPCSLCRDELSLLAARGLISNGTKIVSAVVNPTGTIATRVRVTTYGALCPGRLVEQIELERQRSSSFEDTISNLLGFVAKHYGRAYAHINQDGLASLLRKHMGSKRGSGGGDKSILFGLDEGGDLQTFVFKPFRHREHGRMVSRASAQTIATTVRLALGEKLRRPLIIDFLTLQSVPSSRGLENERWISTQAAVTGQRRIDQLHHETLQRLDPTSIIHVYRLRDEQIISSVCPIANYPLLEGPWDRGRKGGILLGKHQPGEYPRFHFSSQTGLCVKVVTHALGQTLDHYPEKNRRQNSRATASIKRRLREVLDAEGNADECACKNCQMQHEVRKFDKELILDSELLVYATREFRHTWSVKGLTRPLTQELLSHSQELRTLLQRTQRRGLDQRASVVAVCVKGSPGKPTREVFRTAPLERLTPDSPESDPLFGALVQILTQEVTPLELHIGKFCGEILHSSAASRLLDVLTEQFHFDFTVFLHNFAADRVAGSSAANADISLETITRRSAKELSFPLLW